jgi:hypothetical protein
VTNKKQVACSSDTSADFQRTTRRYVAEDELFITNALRTSIRTVLRAIVRQSFFYKIRLYCKLHARNGPVMAPCTGPGSGRTLKVNIMSCLIVLNFIISSATVCRITKVRTTTVISSNNLFNIDNYTLIGKECEIWATEDITAVEEFCPLGHITV